MINIVIPIAGSGSRFTEVGYTTPKPFINICGVSMIERVFENLKIDDARFILIIKEEHVIQYKNILDRLLKKYNLEIISVNIPMQGACSTILFSTWLINNNDSLLLANSDQIVNMNINDYIDDSIKRKLDGSILTFYDDHPKWSYAKVNSKGYLVELREKEVISKHATVGLYYFERGSDFVSSAIDMIVNQDKVNNEFYTAPTYNYSIDNNLKIGIYEINKSQMHGLGTPIDLCNYVNYLKIGDI